MIINFLEMEQLHKSLTEIANSKSHGGNLKAKLLSS